MACPARLYELYRDPTLRCAALDISSGVSRRLTCNPGEELGMRHLPDFLGLRFDVWGMGKISSLFSGRSSWNSSPQLPLASGYVNSFRIFASSGKDFTARAAEGHGIFAEIVHDSHSTSEKQGGRKALFRWAHGQGNRGGTRPSIQNVNTQGVLSFCWASMFSFGEA